MSGPLKTWNGDWKVLPTEGEPFEYNGSTYTWKECECGCERPEGFDESGVESFEMMVRLRGENQGNPVASVLVKLGKIEGVIKTGGNTDQASELLNATLGEIKQKIGNDPEDLDQYLEGQGISQEEMLLAAMDAIGFSPLDMVVMSLMSSLR